jgi:hypothetical protein
MQSEFLMRSICYDTVLLSDKTQYDVFVDSDDEVGERVSRIAEKEIINWFFHHPMNFTDYLFYEELDIDKLKYKPFFEVQKPIITDNEKPGDLDILLVDETKPHHAIAIQVKRVKATIDKNDKISLHPNHIQKGVIQAKKMYEKYKFHRCYLMLVILTDAQLRHHGQQLFRHPSYDEKKTVYFHSVYGDLPAEVGVYFLEVSQPSSNSIDKTARISAKPIDQLNRTTDSILQFLKSKRHQKPN